MKTAKTTAATDLRVMIGMPRFSGKRRWHTRSAGSLDERGADSSRRQKHPRVGESRVECDSVRTIHAKSEVGYYNPDMDETRPVSRDDHDATRTP